MKPFRGTDTFSSWWIQVNNLSILIHTWHRSSSDTISRTGHVSSMSLLLCITFPIVPGSGRFPTIFFQYFIYLLNAPKLKVERNTHIWINSELLVYQKSVMGSKIHRIKHLLKLDGQCWVLKRVSWTDHSSVCYLGHHESSLPFEQVTETVEWRDE